MGVFKLEYLEYETKIVSSTSFDPWHNLALEEYLFREIKHNQVILYLWQNQNTVVIGRNQNAWKECRCNELEQAGGKLARRLSGGGAVYHDLGNLNFTFIMDRTKYDLEKQLRVILEAVRTFNINAQFTGRNDLTVEGRKFSGNAFYFERDKAYHHGTILIDVDVTKLAAYLQVSKEKIVSKGVDSVQARVGNLNLFSSEISIESMKTALMKSFQELYGKVSEPPIIVSDTTFPLENLYNKYSSWDWLYGKTPNFDIVLSKRFLWGGIELGLRLSNGLIDDAKIYSDAMNSHLIDRIALTLLKLPLQIDLIVNAIRGIDVDQEDQVIIDDIINWLLSGVI
ncbi:lipoate--protein ligase [Desulfosporosinus sp. HMP52]|uniref:lipoate--protein ligase n=1 Tax=Desulfosporosinus sp. HMP52 TaxID=1487923 RepID=UPI00051FDFCD|nr:lipoate--protein ligase [Desulfosporosinus sp. HMP52]KGK82231.1 lipoate--protein ligase [Desulfosporosinus sp. HMP52]